MLEIVSNIFVVQLVWYLFYATFCILYKASGSLMNAVATSNVNIAVTDISDKKFIDLNKIPLSEQTRREKMSVI